MSALHKINHEARGRDASKARGEAEWFICVEAACRVLCVVHKQGNTSTIVKNFCLNISVRWFLVA